MSVFTRVLTIFNFNALHGMSSVWTLRRYFEIFVKKHIKIFAIVVH